VTIRYPGTPVTPHGWYHLISGNKPMMWLDAYDESIGIDLLGGLAPPFNDPMVPEAVVLKSLKGLIAPWKHIQQKGATQDGVTHIDALYDPTEVEAEVECIGRDWKHQARVVRDLIASLDAIQQSKLNFFLQEIGHWWAPIRWFQGAPPNPLMVAQSGQPIPLRLQADDSFWRTYDHTALFEFTYDQMAEEFAVDNTATQNLGDVPQYYTGAGGGYCTSVGGVMKWVDDPDNLDYTSSRQVINGPWPDFDTDTDYQVVSQIHGSMQEWSLPKSSRNIIGGRMGRDVDGNWDGSGVFVEYGAGWMRLFYTVNFVDHTLRESTTSMLFPPTFSDKFTLICGDPANPRLFKVQRNGSTILSHKETGTGSPLGPDNRGIGNGMYAAGAVITQATPATIRRLRAGDNATVTQSGFLKRINVGDQKMYDDYTLFGPFTKVKIYDGPGSDEFVEFGPLLPNQIVFLRTDPRSNTTLVQDLTVVPSTPQELPTFQDAWAKWLSFVGSGSNSLIELQQSLFGVRTPQGNLYKYLKGRFSEHSAIPPKSPGNPAQPYFVKVEIVGGNADSKVMASGTPLRRYPL
jgi:hypothetical protein